jgi:uncharacterized protein (DUF885 family)
MKSNRILQLILVVLIIIFVAVGGYLYYANSQDSKKPADLNASISRNQAIINKGLADKAAMDKQAASLTSQLAAANAALAKVNFRSSAESIEYDRLLIGIADNLKILTADVSATGLTERKEGDTQYQVASFSVTVQGLAPDKIFVTPADSTAYINANVTAILAFIDQVANSKDFDTAVIQSVNISEPKPMTDQQILDKTNSIKDFIRSRLTADETANLTDDQITALVESKYTALAGDDLKRIIQQAGYDVTQAVINIDIWTYKKGA